MNQQVIVADAARKKEVALVLPVLRNVLVSRIGELVSVLDKTEKKASLAYDGLYRNQPETALRTKNIRELFDAAERYDVFADLRWWRLTPDKPFSNIKMRYLIRTGGMEKGWTSLFRNRIMRSPLTKFLGTLILLTYF